MTVMKSNAFYSGEKISLIRSDASMNDTYANTEETIAEVRKFVKAFNLFTWKNSNIEMNEIPL